LHLSRQTDTLICAFEAISQQHMRIHNEAHRQSEFQARIKEFQEALLDIAKTVNPNAALDLARREAARDAVELAAPRSRAASL